MFRLAGRFNRSYGDFAKMSETVDRASLTLTLRDGSRHVLRGVANLYEPAEFERFLTLMWERQPLLFKGRSAERT